MAQPAAVTLRRAIWHRGAPGAATRRTQQRGLEWRRLVWMARSSVVAADGAEAYAAWRLDGGPARERLAARAQPSERRPTAQRGGHDRQSGGLCASRHSGRLGAGWWRWAAKIRRDGRSVGLASSHMLLVGEGVADSGSWGASDPSRGAVGGKSGSASSDLGSSRKPRKKKI
jgi:hypothetical protein